MPLFREWRQRLAESGYRDLEVLGLDVERLSGNKGGAPRTGDLRPEYLECLTRDRQEVSVVATYAINPRTEALLRAHHDMPGLTGVETEVLWLLGYEGMSFPQAERQSGLGRFPIWQLVKRALAWDKRNGS